MAPQAKMYPSQYAQQGLISSSSGPGVEVDIGFQATYIKLVNRGPGTKYVNFQSTVATTDDFPISSGETFEARMGQCSGFGLATVSTSTGLGVDVIALG